MKKEELVKKRYFEWMCDIVSDSGRVDGASYIKLFRILNEIDFYYIVQMDENKEADGIDLRYRFGYEEDYDQACISTYLDNHPCSVLEMMVALSIRCEEHIMYDPDIGDRTYLWFWSMIESLGLSHMSDPIFDESTVRNVIDRFLNRKYERDGTGGLFTVEDSKEDLRRMEIWYQMCGYLNKNIGL